MSQTKIAVWNVGDSLWLFTIPSFLMFCFQQSAVLSGKTRPVSWGPSGNRPTLKKQNPVDVGFKKKHKNYEQLQRQATTVRRSVWYCNSRHVWNHKASLITSHSVSSENAANKCHELSLAVPFKSKLPVVDPTHCRRLFGKDICSPLQFDVHREHPKWLWEGHLEVLEEYSDFSKIALGYRYKNNNN